VIDLGAGSRRRVWSSSGGTWHQVRVRYPRFWLRHGREPQPVPPGGSGTRRTTSTRTQLLVVLGLLMLCCVGSVVTCCARNLNVTVNRPGPSASSAP
jgi:hypothetical protein